MRHWTFTFSSSLKKRARGVLFMLIHCFVLQCTNSQNRSTILDTHFLSCKRTRSGVFRFTSATRSWFQRPFHLYIHWACLVDWSICQMCLFNQRFILVVWLFFEGSGLFVRWWSSLNCDYCPKMIWTRDGDLTVPHQNETPDLFPCAWFFLFILNV